jgi:hypothetical protein
MSDEHPVDPSPLAGLNEKLDRPQHESLKAAVFAFQAEAPKLAKDKTAEVVSKRTGGKYTYKFTPLADIMAAIQSLLTKHGLVWSCAPGENEAGKPILDYELAHIASDAPKVGRMPLMLAEQSSQAHGSALTYAKRQALEAVLNLVAEADDDGKAASKRPTGDARPLPAASRKKMLAEIESSGKDLAVLLSAVGLEGVEDATVGDAKQIKALL